jgi:hypothetical protein
VRVYHIWGWILARVHHSYFNLEVHHVLRDEATIRLLQSETLSLRMHGDRCDVLDDMLKHGAEVPDQELQAALIEIGLPQAFVLRRITAVKPRPPRRKKPIT